MISVDVHMMRAFFVGGCQRFLRIQTIFCRYKLFFEGYQPVFLWIQTFFFEDTHFFHDRKVFEGYKRLCGRRKFSEIFGVQEGFFCGLQKVFFGIQKFFVDVVHAHHVDYF